MTTVPATSQVEKIHLVECPRDAMQGWKTFIPTEQKTAYINALLQVGFDTLDFGSFVSPKAIPQMADTKAVLSGIRMGPSKTKLLAITGNVRGAKEACEYDEISYVGFPFSVSETFQQRNTNSSIEAALNNVEEIRQVCLQKGKQPVIYISMGFGNPYGDVYSEQIVFQWVKKIAALDISIISLADTVGLATPAQVLSLTTSLIKAYPAHQIGVHLHSASTNWKAKVDAALQAGCKRFDGALKGIGGCPMANDELVGNMDSEKMIAYFEELGLLNKLDKPALQQCSDMALALFS
jgi:hydroxymethylglutaryl-CoA lyase